MCAGSIPAGGTNPLVPPTSSDDPERILRIPGPPAGRDIPSAQPKRGLETRPPSTHDVPRASESPSTFASLQRSGVEHWRERDRVSANIQRRTLWSRRNSLDSQTVALRIRGRLCAALFAGAVVSGWLALVLLARITPALFPGQALPLNTNLPSALAVVDIESPGEESVFNQPIVVLLAAVDSRPGTNSALAAVNTDSIMLVRLDPVAKDIRVLSVPRDLLITVTYEDGSRAESRVNTSFAIGAADGKGSDAGMQHLLHDLEEEFGLEIDYWAQVDFRGRNG